MSSRAYRLLERGAVALRPYLDDRGELNDPVFGEPTQYGTAYFAYVNAVLASTKQGEAREELLRAAAAGMRATLRHLMDPDDTYASAADYTHAVGSPGYRNLRDFMWPPVMRTFRLLREMDFTGLDDVRDMIRAVVVPDAFSERPPVNWAAVWILGEWMRIEEGLSPFTKTDIDEWLTPFFSEAPDVDHGFYRELQHATGVEITWTSAIDLEKGFYREPGVPNSYDLWSRVHLLELLVEGYEGRFRPEMEQLLVSGVRRSLDVQLSSGSLATAYRSSAHLWNLTGQSWYFSNAARLLEKTEPELARRAGQAALRALRAAEQCLRPTGDISPVENVFPANWRVGYEVYTEEAHYVGLPLAYLATAVLEGFEGEGDIDQDTEVRRLLELDPVNRFLAHGSGWSVHVNLAPFTGYDSLGIADITLGLGRRLRFGGQTHYGRADALPDEHRLSNQIPFTLGLAVRGEHRSVFPVSAMTNVSDRWVEESSGGFRAGAAVDGSQYEVAVDIDGDVVHITESMGEVERSLLIPYLTDRGDGVRTVATVHEDRVTLASGGEVVEIVVNERVARVIHLPFGYESRHGLVGLIRLDLEGSGAVAYDVVRVR